MIRAPIDKTGSHLSAMSAYLIPRKKPTELARLIIDFSHLTNIIQSPPAIVPDIGATLMSPSPSCHLHPFSYDKPKAENG